MRRRAAEQERGFDPAEVGFGRTAGLNYVRMFACFLPLTGASSSSSKAEAQTTTNGGGWGGLMLHLASISPVFYLQIPHFIANTDAVIYSGVRFQLDHKHNFYDSSLTRGRMVSKVGQQSSA